jgi:hypothetical protein
LASCTENTFCGVKKPVGDVMDSGFKGHRDWEPVTPTRDSRYDFRGPVKGAADAFKPSEGGSTADCGPCTLYPENFDSIRFMRGYYSIIEIVALSKAANEKDRL